MEKIYTEEEMERLRIEDRPYEVYATELAMDTANTYGKLTSVGAMVSVFCFGFNFANYIFSGTDLGTLGIGFNAVAGVSLACSAVGFVNWKREKKQARQNLWAYKLAVDEIWKGKYKFEFAPSDIGTYMNIDREIKSHALTYLKYDEINKLEREM